MPWYIILIISVSASAFISFLIYAYRWLDLVSKNHLPHIEAAINNVASSVSTVATTVAVLSTSEQNHHEEVMRQLSKD